MRSQLFTSKLFKTATRVVVILLAVAVFVYLAPSVLAQASVGLEAVAATGLGTADIRVIIVKIIQVLLGFLGLVAVTVILYGGYIYMTSEGEPDKIAKAKNILLNGAVGLVIILSAFAIVTYIINRMNEVIFGGGAGPGGQPGFNINSGALGGGVLESVYPEPWAENVPRNTLIMVTFKETMDIGTIISNTTHPDCQTVPNLTCGILAGALESPNVQIINQDDNNSILPVSEVMAMTMDGKNFVFDPYGLSLTQFLGSPNGYTNYAVNLSDNINKGNGQPAFLAGGYTWNFTISDVLDLTPPVVEDKIPQGDNVYRNAIIQIDFSEAINAAAAVGQTVVDPDGQLTPDSYNIITVSYDDNGTTKYVSGNFAISNQFRTITFISDAPCLDEQGQPVQNSCGEDVYCLPANEEVTVLVKAAQVSPFNPFSGISDTAANSLDGNSNGTAQGPPDDNYTWNFTTNNELYLEPPQIVVPLEPVRDEVQVPLNKKAKALFNTNLLSSSINSTNISIFKFICNGPEFPSDPSCYPPNGFTVYKENVSGTSRVVIKSYSPYLEPLTKYNPRLTSGIKDGYQNCFYPACGPDSNNLGSPAYNPECL